MKNKYSLWELPNRMAVLGLSVLAGCIFIGIMSMLIGDTKAGIVLLDSQSELFKSVYPLTLQNIMHILFFIGLGELFVRWRTAIREQRFMDQHYLPEDDETVLQFQDLGPIRLQVSDKFDGENGFLPSLIDLCILQFQSSRSIDQAVSVLNSSLELIAHRVDLRYTMLRYIAWAIPTFGFHRNGDRYILHPEHGKPGLSRPEAIDHIPGRGLQHHPGGAVFERHPGVVAPHCAAARGTERQPCGTLHLAQSDQPALHRRGVNPMKPRNREINIFNLSMLDVISGALGAFLIIMIVLFPYYKKDPVDCRRRMAELTEQLNESKQRAEAAQAEAERTREQLEAAQRRLAELTEQLNESEQRAEAAQAEAERTREQLEAAQRQLAKTFLVIYIRWPTLKHDIDLHVVDPSGAEFYYKKKTISGRPGELSEDSQSGPGNEVWEIFNAPPGNYKIYAELFHRHKNNKTPTVKGRVITRDGSLLLPEIRLTVVQKKAYMATVTVATDGSVRLSR